MAGKIANIQLEMKDGVKAATAGALKVASEKGILSLLPPGTKDTVSANLACIRIEQIKIFAKVASGELSVTQATDLMGRTTVSSIYSLGWGATGMGIGASVLSWIPVVGPVIGGLTGGLVGSMAGFSRYCSIGISLYLSTLSLFLSINFSTASIALCTSPAYHAQYSSSLRCTDFRHLP